MSATEQHCAAGTARNSRYGKRRWRGRPRKPTVDCDAKISYCRQWVDLAFSSWMSVVVTLSSCCWDLSHISCIFCGFNRSRLLFINSSHTSLKAVDCVVRVGRQWVDIQLSVVGVEVSRRTMWHYDVEQLGRVEKEQQWPEYRALWYTHSKMISNNRLPAYATRWERSVRNDRIQLKTCPDTPTNRCKCISKMSWSTQSNTALRSSSASNVTRFWSAAAKTLDMTRSSAISIEWQRR